MALEPTILVDTDATYTTFVEGGEESTAPVAGPFYFAWVDEEESSFGSEHHRMDEYIFSADFVRSEGEKPKLTLVIENPRVGLLSVLRKQWCWFAWHNGTEVVPLFFGRVVGIPSDMQGEVITVTFIAWPSNYVKQLQKVAHSLKIAPYYDPVFTDVSRRDDPLAILEAHSKLICVDPVTLEVSASDVLDAEDGNVDFTEDDHFYNSMQCSPSGVPKTAVHVDATVSWLQTAHGYLDMGTNQITSYSGDGIVGEWPKPLSQIAPGLTMFAGGAYDVAQIDTMTTINLSYSWQSRSKTHADGDTLSVNTTASFPAGAAPNGGRTTGFGVSSIISYTQQQGFLDPFATDGDGDPAPTNIPPSLNYTMAYAFPYSVKTSMVLEYRAERPHTERVIFRLFADVQPTTLDPLVSEDTETIVISGSDVGMPIIDLLNWTSVSGESVVVGTVIFPDDPQLPGGRTAQVAIVAGTAGEESPDFSDVAGEETIDGTVTWASLGVAAPTESAGDWAGVTNVNAGAVILPRRPVYSTYEVYTQTGRMKFPPTGTSVSKGLIVQASNGSFQVCTQSGDTDRFAIPAFSATRGVVVSDGSAQWTSLGTTLPTGTTYFVATTGGQTGSQYVIPSFNNTLHATTADGSVVWTSVGTGDIPAGGTPGNVHADSYFALDRGRISFEHLICRARARLRYASRAVMTSFQCEYARGLELSLRKSATLHDYRLPGGLIAGKVTGIAMTASAGAFTCNVVIGSAVGNATTINAVQGDAEYVDDDYVEDEYQTHENNVVLLPVLSDVGYTPIVPTPDYDGIRFPLEKSMIVVTDETHGDIDDQVIAINSAFESMKKSQGILALPSSSIDQMIQNQNRATLEGSNTVALGLQTNPIWHELEFKPLNGNGSFNKVYHAKCTVLSLPKMIDLEEESTS